MAETRIGISGYNYPRWRGVFYPKGLRQADELEYASRRFNSIEINASFYSLQRPTSYEAWYSAAPPDFVFAVKGGRFITHMKKLRDAATPLANFFASGVLCLKEKLGPVLWQLPPNLGFHAERLEEFFALLPRDTEAAAELARRHDARPEGRSATETDECRPIRHALEVRHETFQDGAFVDLLRKSGIALVIADTAGKFPWLEDVTADFLYVRLHGGEELYVSGYSDEDLDRWAAQIQAWRCAPPAQVARARQAAQAAQAAQERAGSKVGGRRGARDVYVYFDNDAKVRAPFDAMGLAKRLLAKKKPAARAARSPELRSVRK